MTDPTNLERVTAERDSLGRETDRLRADWVEMRDRAEKAEAALEQMTAERDRWLAMVERMSNQHMRFGVIQPDGSTEMLPCADWCYACKGEELARLKSCQDPHCKANYHVIPGEVPPELPEQRCVNWMWEIDHDDHEWESVAKGRVQCPGWDSEGAECECGQLWPGGQMPPWHNDMNCEADPE